MESQATSELFESGEFQSELDNVEKAEEIAEEPIDPRSLLTSEQIQQYKDIFSALDMTGRGKIQTKLLSIVVRSLGHNPTKAQIQEYMSAADPEGQGMMNFHGFLLPMAQIIDAVPESFDDLLLAFKTLDEDKVGYINTTELIECLTNFGEYLDDFEIDLLIKMADRKGEGKIMYEEFLEKMFGIQKKKPGRKKGKKKK